MATALGAPSVCAIGSFHRLRGWFRSGCGAFKFSVADHGL